MEALFKRYFEQEKNICDVEVLASAATEAGLDVKSIADATAWDQG